MNALYLLKEAVLATLMSILAGAFSRDFMAKNLLMPFWTKLRPETTL
jgi:hypothetical protein